MYDHKKDPHEEKRRKGRGEGGGRGIKKEISMDKHRPKSGTQNKKVGRPKTDRCINRESEHTQDRVLVSTHSEAKLCDSLSTITQPLCLG